MNAPCALSIVIPCYQSGAGLAALVQQAAALRIDGGHEIVLVNDGSTDQTAATCERLVHTAGVPITFVDLARNYGEHNAVMAGLRHTRGEWVVTMDDDGQNPPSEVERLFRFARESGRDVVYARYARRRHAPWRNAGSRLANRAADLVIDKPRGLYLCSFRCINAFVVEQICRYEGPFPYVDGLIFQVTTNVDSCPVAHEERQSGRSGYTLQRLIHLCLSMFLNFSVLPLRLSSALGMTLSLMGFLGVIVVVIEHFVSSAPWGYGSLMSALLIFSGIQLLVLGVVGEYVGRIYLTANQRPQSVVRRVERSELTG
ncbi:MAG: glycosyltransferase family 2 protein [Candidatus Binatia bacterium]